MDEDIRNHAKENTWFSMYLTATVAIGTPCFNDTFFNV
jgi:hypothetical protein